MIQEEKDRLEILRIAVTLTIPKSSGMPIDKVGEIVIKLATEMQKFVKGNPDG